MLHLGARATGLFDPHEGGLVRQRLPRYWYVSWRRYFVLAHGKAYALLAALAWTLGYLLLRLRCLLTWKPLKLPANMARDFWRIGLGPSRSRMAPPPRLGHPTGDPPGWVRIGERYGG